MDGEHLLHGVIHLNPEAMTVDTALTQGLAQVIETFKLLLDLRQLVLDYLFHFPHLLPSVRGCTLLILSESTVRAASLLGAGVVRHFGLV